MVINIDLENPDWMGRLKNPIEKGFDPEDEEELYKSIDNVLSSGSELPRGTKQLAKEIEYDIYHGLRKAVNVWFSQMSKDEEPISALADLKMGLMIWGNISKEGSSNTIQELYDRSLESGFRKSGKDKPTYTRSVKHMVNKSTGIGPALDKFREDCYSNISKIMSKHIHDGEHAMYREKREIDSWLRKQRYQTRLMIKTEVAKIANFGLIESWGYDNDKFNYNYFWNAIVDERTKEISRIRKSGNPYTFDEIKWLWKNQEQRIGNRWVGDQYNQRCSISRQKIEKDFTGNRFIGRENEFRETM